MLAICCGRRHRGLAMLRKTKNGLTRRTFVASVAAGGAGMAWMGRSQAQSIGRTPLPRSARDRLEDALTRIADTSGEGARACLTIYADAARVAADAADARARAGASLGPLDGSIVSIKDLFDVAGEPTRVGSLILRDAPPAKADHKMPAQRELG